MTATKTVGQPDSTPNPEKAKPRINLDAEAPERETVQAGGKLYEIARLDDFGIGDQQRLDRDGREFAGLWNSQAELTDDQSKRVKLLLDRIFDKLLPDAPKSVKAKFRDGHRAELVLDFSVAPFRQQLAAQMVAAMMAQQQEEAGSGEPTTAT